MASTKKQIARVNATGVIVNRSGLLREIAFMRTPSVMYAATIHRLIATKEGLLIMLAMPECEAARAAKNV